MAKTVLIAAGGTGGHVFPGLATAAALRRVHPDLAVEFVGTAERLEATLVPKVGFTLHTVPAIQLARGFSPSTLKLPFVLASAVRRVVALIREREVVAAVGFGGYTSVPLALAARLTRTPLVVHEQNAIAGLANRLAARAATAVAVSYEEAMGSFGGTPTVLTGNPVRPDLLPEPARADDLSGAQIREVLRPQGLDTFGLDRDRRTLLVFGGSQGAQRINEATAASATLWADPGGIQILHATGARSHDESRIAWLGQGIDPDGRAQSEGLKVVCTEFIDRMDLAYAAADVVVCRAGASSIAELTALAVPSILVPYPHATADHQTANAMALQRVGGAVVIADENLDAGTLVGAAQPLLRDRMAYAAMQTRAAEFGRPEAAVDLASLITSVFAGQGRPT
ncbi:MAG: undecaprenyldiphospho-muramoylpentapeptide beta-N-acetylglucosaminyltransferase [Euzebya sp.]